MFRALLGIGTNLGDKRQNLQNAIDSLKFLPNTNVLDASSIYQTAPIGYDMQDDFYNAVVLVETEFSPNALFGICMGIEAAMGRKRNIKNGPRIIDIDLLIYENVKMDVNELTLPHPRMLQRRFVLEPIKELFPSGRALGVSFGNKLSEVQEQEIKQLPIRLLINGGIN